MKSKANKLDPLVFYEEMVIYFHFCMSRVIKYWPNTISLVSFDVIKLLPK